MRTRPSRDGDERAWAAQPRACRLHPAAVISLLLAAAVAVHADPSDPAVKAAVKDAYGATHPARRAQAAALLETEVAADPENLEFQEALGVLYLDKMNDAAKALPHLEKVAELLPNDAGWLQALARGYRQAGNLDRAAELYQKAEALLPADAWVRNEHGKILSELHRDAEAEEVFRAAVAIDGRSAYLRIALAQSLMAQKKRAAAATVLRDVLKDEPQQSVAAALLAQCQDAPSAPPRPAAEPGPAPALDQLIASAYATGDHAKFVQAAALLETDLEQHPGALANRKLLGSIYLEKLQEAAKALPHLEKIAVASPHEVVWLQMLAECYLETGQPERAVEVYHQCEELSPNDAWLRHEHGKALAELHRDQEAEEVFRSAVALDGQSTYLRVALAQSLLAQGKRAEAAALLFAVLQEEPQHAGARALLAQCTAAPAPTHAAASDQDQGVEQLVAAAYKSGDREKFVRAAAALEAHLAQQPGDLANRKSLGFIYLDKLKEPAKALPHLQKVTEALPQDADWLLLLARCCKEGGQLVRAAELYEKCAALQPADPWVRYEEGKILGALHRNVEAEAVLRGAVAIDEKNAFLRAQLGEALLAQGKRAEAVSLARAILGSEPRQPAALALLAQCNRQAPPLSPLQRAVAAAYTSGDPARFTAAAELLEAWLRAHPGDLANRKSLGFIYLDKLNEPKQAIPHLQQVVAALPKDTGWLQLLAKADENEHDFAGAADAYRRTAELAPRDLWARYHLGGALNKLGRPRDAQAAYEAALSIDPRNEYVLLELARLHEAAGRHRQARELARSVEREHPGDPDAHTLAGDLDRADWNFSAARGEYHTALQERPGDGSAQFGLSELAKASREQSKLVFYTFDDTDHLRQTGIFAYSTLLVNGPVQLAGFTNELFFKQPPGPVVDRFETGLSLTCHIERWLLVAGGVSEFKTHQRGGKAGGNAALYVTPARAWDFWGSYHSADPVNDSYTTVRDAFSQSILSGGLNLRPTRSLSASFTAISSTYSDHNYRDFALGSLGYNIFPKAGATVRLEYQWYTFAHHTSDYSSSQDYALIRPVLELEPQLTSWLKLQIRGELSYVVDERQWGTGLVAGPRITRGDWFECGFSYLNYQVPGGQTSWSGSGFKVDFALRF